MENLKIAREVLGELSKPDAVVCITTCAGGQYVVRLGEIQLLEHLALGEWVIFCVSPSEWFSWEPRREPRKFEWTSESDGPMGEYLAAEFSGAKFRLVATEILEES